MRLSGRLQTPGPGCCSWSKRSAKLHLGDSDGSVPIGKPTDNCYKVILESSSQMRFAMSTAWSSSITARVALIVPSSAWAG